MVRGRVASDYTQGDYANPGIAAVKIPVGGKVQRVRVTATKLVERKNDYIFALAELRALDAAGKNLANGCAVTSLDSIEAPVRWARQNLTDGKWARGGDPSLVEKLSKAQSERAKILVAVETPQRVNRREKLKSSIKQAEKKREALPIGKMVYAAADRFQTARQLQTNGWQTAPHSCAASRQYTLTGRSFRAGCDTVSRK